MIRAERWTQGELLPLGRAALVQGAAELRRGDLELVRLAADLDADSTGGQLAEAERSLLALADALPPTPPERLAVILSEIRRGGDPLGHLLCQARPAIDRRARGAFYTPPEIVQPMVDWVLRQGVARIVDPGCGSGRFAARVARQRRDLEIVAVDVDPVATLVTRATLRALGAQAVTVLHSDYTSVELPQTSGRTAFVGNPPYVRHHDLTPESKRWASQAANRWGLRLSTLAGLHVHFYLATLLHARLGDVGCFVTSAEWLDVNYGSALRRLFLDGLGGLSLHLVDPHADPFAGAMTTAVIGCFEVGAVPASVRVRSVSHPTDLDDLDAGREVTAQSLRAAERWSAVLAGRESSGFRDGVDVPLGMVARVHRGLVTGANDFFVLTREKAGRLGILEWCKPAITTAEEVLAADGMIRDGPERRLLLDVPPDVDRSAHHRLDAYLRLGEESVAGEAPISARYIPSHRRPWWFLGRWSPAPIVASYMARQAPRFALNPDGLAIVNVVHGLYPRQPLNPSRLEALVAILNGARDSFRGSGRTYHGGLEKFEPREMERLIIPGPEEWR